MLGGGEMAYESPDYRVVETMGDVEIRQYESYLVAEATVDGTLETAGNEGFRILAKYIFGANQGERKIAMTAPVTQEKAEGTKISMTTPVTQERSGDQFIVRFMMPSEFSRETLPEPNDPRIRIEEAPARRLAAIRYSGRWTKDLYDRHLAALRDTLRDHGCEAVGEPVWARYNPPFMPWFLRRNEILTAFREVATST
ncbi:MAG: hypothetical protein AMJ62_03595 [Myxococcales bacterium SG8_38]|nr:MAG: hypothetical protein AMJ62_03595 [Myxococcales bacterium SG8_38]